MGTFIVSSIKDGNVIASVLEVFDTEKGAIQFAESIVTDSLFDSKTHNVIVKTSDNETIWEAAKGGECKRWWDNLVDQPTKTMANLKSQMPPHSPTPWRLIVYTGRDYCEIRDADNNNVHTSETRNAEFIVLACNQYAEKRD